LQAQKLESLGQLAAGISHEINTPTQFIGHNAVYLNDSFGDLASLYKKYNTLVEKMEESGLFPELLSEIKTAVEDADLEFLFEEIPDTIQNVIQGVERISRIVRAMKEFSHPGLAQKRHSDINHLLETSITVCYNEIKNASELATEFEPDLPLVPCYPGELNQVFVNLLMNAAHAITDVVGETEEKGCIRVVTTNENEMICIEISDTGAGIPSKIHDRVFDPFFTTKEVGEGSGQGLSISRSIVVERHKGTLTFKTEEGEGTRFFIRLPLDSDSL
jgi:signal transduction histidine kinase